MSIKQHYPVELPGNPTAALEAVPKQYVDGLITTTIVTDADHTVTARAGITYVLYTTLTADRNVWLPLANGPRQIITIKDVNGLAQGPWGGLYIFPQPGGSDTLVPAGLNVGGRITSPVIGMSITLINDGVSKWVEIDVHNAHIELYNNFKDHLADTVDAHDASAVSFVPNGSIAATDVQAAIQEVRDEATGGGAPVLTLTATKTANYTAAVGELVLADTSAGIFTVTFPSAPADKSVIAVRLLQRGSAQNTLTLARGGTDTFAGNTTYPIYMGSQTVYFQYQASTGWWYVLSTAFSVAEMGRRFLQSRTTDKTSTYTAVEGDLVVCDTTSGTVTITLPTAPVLNTRISVKLIIKGGSNNVSVVTGGSDVFENLGGATTYTLSTLNQVVMFQYNSSGSIWTVVSDSLGTTAIAKGGTGEVTAGAALTALGGAPLASPTFTGVVTSPAYSSSGLTGATQASRYVGSTTSGAPVSGTFAIGDFVIARNGKVFVCTTAGSPGTWTDIGGLSNALNSANIFVGNGSNIATSVVVTGDVTISNAGVTAIGATKVTNAMLAGSIDLTAKVTGILPVANGGTGISTGQTRVIEILVTDPAGSALTTGDGKAYFIVPAVMNNYKLTAVLAGLTTVSSSGIPTFQIANVTDAWDMLTTKLTVDASEVSSVTAAAAAVIDTASSHDVVTTGDILRIDCDVAGTGAKGVMVAMTFTAP